MRRGPSGSKSKTVSSPPIPKKLNFDDEEEEEENVTPQPALASNISANVPTPLVIVKPAIAGGTTVEVARSLKLPATKLGSLPVGKGTSMASLLRYE